MPDTLKARLGKLHSLQELADTLQIKVEEKEFSDAEVRILREFYAQDPLAYAVAGGRDSYQTRIGFIEEKYGTFWRMAIAPRKDALFDQEVLRVLGSINGVGEYRYLFGNDYISPRLFTTLGRRKSTRGPDLLALGVGGTFSLVAGLMVYYTPECYKAATECYKNDTDKALVASFVAAIALPISYGVATFFHGVSIDSPLSELRNAAQKTDEFLRKHYV